MAVVIDTLKINGLRVIHFKQLLSYVKDCGDTGIYYGNIKHFERRHKDLEEWLETSINILDQEGVVIQKK